MGHTVDIHIMSPYRSPQIDNVFRGCYYIDHGIPDFHSFHLFYLWGIAIYNVYIYDYMYIIYIYIYI